VAAILVINEVPDAEADRRARKRTLVVRSGARGARVIYRSLTLLALAASGAAIARHVLPVWYAIPALGLAALGVIAAGRISMDRSARPRLKQAIELTLAVQAAGCGLMIIALLIERYA
jgi:1,4-dihydroxy-2-naphthoate octaprenyltransferase